MLTLHRSKHYKLQQICAVSLPTEAENPIQEELDKLGSYEDVLAKNKYALCFVFSFLF